jgi:hypothetical protein
MTRRTRRPSLLLLLSLAAVVLATPGCWLQVGADAGHDGYNPFETTISAATAATLAQAWSLPVTLGTAREPTIAGGRAVMTLGPGSAPHVRAMRLEDGATVWDTPLGPSGPIAFSHTAISVEGRWWASHMHLDSATSMCSAAISRIDAESGASTDLSFPLGTQAGPLTVSDGLVAFVTAGPCPSNGGTPGTANLVVMDSATGATRWTHTWVGFDSGRPVDILPTVADGRVFVVVDATLYAFDLAGCGTPTCNPIWTQSAPDNSGPIVAGPDGRIFRQAVHFSTSSPDQFNYLNAYATDTGAVLYSRSNNSELTVAGGTAVTDVVDSSGIGTGIQAFDSGCTSGDCTLWSASVPGAWLVVSAGDLVYVAAPDSVSVFALAGCGAAACSPLKTLTVPGRVASMVVGEGTLLVATYPSGGPDAMLTAFRPSS